jgi:chromosome segregation ATPase
MSEIIIARNSNIIATEIKIIKNQTAQTVLMASIDIGKRLIEAKELLAHGEWQSWLEEQIDYKQSTANNLMRIAKEYEDSSDKLKSISYSQAVALLALPEEDREEFISENDVSNMSVRELQEAIKAKEEAENERDEFKKNAVELSEKMNEATERAEEAEEEARSINQDFKELKASIEEIESKNKKNQQNLEAEKKKLLDTIKKLEAEKEVISAEVVLPDEELDKIRQEERDKHQKLIDEQKAKVTELENKLKKTANTSIMEFKVYFESTQNSYNKMIECISKIEDDKETIDKLKGALIKLLDEFKKGI